MVICCIQALQAGGGSLHVSRRCILYSQPVFLLVAVVDAEDEAIDAG
jgi:hypothetical protein